jgi:translocation and assembly module TamB
MNSQSKPKKYLFKFLKVIGWITLSIVALLIVISLSIQIPYVQNKLIQEAVGFLKGKIGTEVRIDRLSLSIPKKIVLTGLYFEDQQKDTLLYAGELAINTDLWQLTQHTIQLNDVELSNFTGSIERLESDSSFNFDYIIKAFAGDTTTAPDTTQTPWKFSIGDVMLDKIHFSFKDGLQGNDFDFHLGVLEIGLDEFDLEKSVIKVNDINIEHLKADIVQYKLAADTVTIIADSTTQDTTTFDISFDEIDLKDIQAKYTHRSTGQSVNLNLGELALDAKDIDLRKREIHLERFALLNTFVSYQQMAGYSPAQEKTDTIKTPPEKSAWDITLKELDLSNNSIQYHNFNEPQKLNQFDANHVWISRLNTQAEDIEVKGKEAKGELNRLSFKNKNEFSVTSFQTAFAISDSSLQLNNFNFNSPNTKIKLNAQADFSSLSTLSEHYSDAEVKIAITESVIGWKDILYFMPALSDSMPLHVPTKTTIRLNTKMQGALKDLTIQHLAVQTLDNTVINTHGTLQLSKEIFMDMQLDKFYTTQHDINSIVPDTLIPSTIALPEWLNLKGQMKGTFESPNVNAILTSNLGTANLKAKLTRDKSSGITRYNGKLSLDEFNAGKLLKKEATLGTITLAVSVDGSGLKMEELNTRLGLSIVNVTYNGYTYKDFKLNGSLKKYFFSGVAELHDKNLDLRLDGDLDYTNDVPNYHFVFDLNNADFKALNLSERPLKARGTLNVDLATSDFKVINGKLDIHKVAIYNGEAMYAVDSLLFASIDQNGHSEISIRSDILDGNFTGKINLYSLSDVITRQFNSYFSLHDTSYTKPVAPQDFKFDLTIKNTDLITEILIPDLDPFVPGKIAGSFDSKLDQLDLSINLTKVRYAGVGTDSITFDVNSNKESLNYTFAVRKIQMDTIRIEAVKLFGNVSHDSIHTKLTILDSLQKEKYVFGGIFHSLEKVFQFNFSEDQVIMNYSPWAAPSDNSLQFTSKGIRAHNFSITNINESIALKTPNNQDSTVSIVFKDLNLQNITNLIEGATPLDGLANGDLNLMAGKKGSFNTKLRIDELEILNQTWGDLTLALGSISGGPLNIDLRIEGENTDLSAIGYYKADSITPEVNLVAKISKLGLRSIEPLTMGALKNTKGQLTGEVKIAGNAKSPDLKGELKFANASFTPSLVNSEFTIANETIAFSGERIVVNDFEIKDRKNNIAKLDGDIKTEMFKSFNMNLSLTAKDFQILNSTEDDNELFYGNVGVTTKAKITGTLIQPVIDMNISLSDDSNFTYVVPQSEKGVMEAQGIVRWVDRDAEKDPFLAGINPKDTMKANFSGIDFSANIELNEKETFNIIIDPATGDKLTVKGNSTLTLDIDPTGDMVLAGRYEIAEGSYDLSFYKIVKRKFLIEKGGTIMWSGTPLDATLNIRAMNEVETSPIELMGEGADQSYKKRLPFLVYLQIKGEILAPEISFQLDMPESKRNEFDGRVYAIIRDINTRESELNKQVFALLVLKRFISDNPLDNRAGSDAESTARRSVSRLLSEQLNRLSENVKGVELSFDVKSSEDYSSGSSAAQTQLQLGLSKSLMDDRLIVKVSGNVDVEGEEASKQNSVSDFIGDLALEYKLTPDGRFRITGFRKSSYDMVNQEIIETGAGLIYIKDYNTLRELFKANAKEN